MENTNPTEKTWRIHFPTGVRFQDGYHEGYPEWVRKAIKDPKEYNYTSVIIWDNSTQKVATLSASEALNLLEKLRTTDGWKESGVSINERVQYFEISTRRRKKTKTNIAGEKPDIPFEKNEWRDIELLHLPSEAGIVLIEALKKNKTDLLVRAKKDNQFMIEKLQGIYKLLFDSGRVNEEKKIDFPSRKFSWTPLSKPHKWLCIYKGDRGVIYPTTDCQ